MCLLDGVLRWERDSILCVSNTHRDPTNPLCRHGRLSALHAFEYGAQAAAVHGGLQARETGIAGPSAILAALRGAHLHIIDLDSVDAPLQVRAIRLLANAG